MFNDREEGRDPEGRGSSRIGRGTPQIPGLLADAIAAQLLSIESRHWRQYPLPLELVLELLVATADPRAMEVAVFLQERLKEADQPLPAPQLEPDGKLQLPVYQRPITARPRSLPPFGGF